MPTHRRNFLKAEESEYCPLCLARDTKGHFVVKGVNGMSKVLDEQIEQFELYADEAAGADLHAEELSRVRSLGNCVACLSSALTSGCVCLSSVGSASSFG